METRQWQRTPRPGKSLGRWKHVYVTLNPGGNLCLNRYTFERLGEPEAAVLLFERSTQTIGVQSAKLTEADAFPVCRKTKKPGRVIHAARLIREWNIQLPYGVHFHRANFNTDGILILDLRETRRAQRPRAEVKIMADAG